MRGFATETAESRMAASHGCGIKGAGLGLRRGFELVEQTQLAKRDIGGDCIGYWSNIKTTVRFTMSVNFYLRRAQYHNTNNLNTLHEVSQLGR